MNITLAQLVELAREVETTDPIDWGMLSIEEEPTYNLIAASVLELYYAADESEREVTALAVTTKLVVENFVLNLKLRQAGQLV